MPNSIDALVPTALTYLTTYLLHSTLLLGTTWLIVRLPRIRSPLLHERLWKLAAVGGLITVPLQLGLDVSHPVLTVLLDVREEQAKHTMNRVGRPANDSRNGPISRQGDDRRGSLPSPTHFTEPASLIAERSAKERSGKERSGKERSGKEGGGKVRREPHRKKDDAASQTRRAAIAESRADWAADDDMSTLGWPMISAIVSPALFLLSGLALVGLSKLSWESFAFRRRLSRTRTLHHGKARAALDHLLQQLSRRRTVQLLTSKDCSEPAAFGILQWRIVLPDEFEDKLRDDELFALLAHELAHLARGDTLWLCVGRLLCSCCAFQPLNFLARREWRQMAEYQCDDWAVQQGASALSLARCLTQVAAWKNARRQCAASLAASGTKSNITDRVERLVDANRCHTERLELCSRHGLWPIALVATLTMPCWGPRTVLYAHIKPATEESVQDAVTDALANPLTDATFDGSLRHEADRNEPRENPDDSMLWRDVVHQADQLRTELTSLDESMRELTETLSQSALQSDAQRCLEQLRAQQSELTRRRKLLDAIVSFRQKIRASKRFDRGQVDPLRQLDGDRQ